MTPNPRKKAIGASKLAVTKTHGTPFLHNGNVTTYDEVYNMSAAMSALATVARQGELAISSRRPTPSQLETSARSVADSIARLSMDTLDETVTRARALGGMARELLSDDDMLRKGGTPGLTAMERGAALLVEKSVEALRERPAFGLARGRLDPADRRALDNSVNSWKEHSTRALGETGQILDEMLGITRRAK